VRCSATARCRFGRAAWSGGTAAAIATTCLEALDTGAELAHQQLEAVRQDFSLDRWTTTWLRVIEQTAAR